MLSFRVYAIQSAQIQAMSWFKDGVWVTVRRESVIRLYHIETHELVQTVDINQICMNLMCKSIYILFEFFIFNFVVYG